MKPYYTFQMEGHENNDDTDGFSRKLKLLRDVHDFIYDDHDEDRQREAFLDDKLFLHFRSRVRSFTGSMVATCYSFNPWILARFGFRYADKTVSCSDCGYCIDEVCFKNMMDESNRKAAIKKMVDFHGKSCIYKNNPVPGLFCAPEIMTFKEILRHLNRQFSILKPIGYRIEKMQFSDYDSIGISEGEANAIISKLDTVVSAKLLLVALFGWTAFKRQLRDTDDEKLECMYCCGSFYPSAFSSNGYVSSQDTEQVVFNPATEHYYWCPIVRNKTIKILPSRIFVKKCVPYWRYLVSACLRTFSINDLSGILYTDDYADLLNSLHLVKYSEVFQVPVRNYVRIPHWEYHIRFSPEDGRKVPCTDVLNRFKRLNTGMWIRRYMKDEPWLTNSLAHKTCTPLECQILEKMVSRFWQRPRYYVDDPYEPYNQRYGISESLPKSLNAHVKRPKILMDENAKRQIVANLANFAYDPVNHEFLTTLRVHILFSDCLNETDPSMVEFALGGLCNMIQQPICRQFVLENLSEKVVSLLNSSNVETVVSALTVLIFLLHDPKIKNAEIIAKVEMLAERSNQVRIVNLAKLFIRRAFFLNFLKQRIVVQLHLHSAMSNYIVTAKAATAVTNSLHGSFTAPGSSDLIIFKNSRFEVHSVSQDGLQYVTEGKMFGRIGAAKLFTPKGENKALMIIVTLKQDVAIVEYDNGRIKTLASRNISENFGRPASNGILLSVHPDGEIIGLRIMSSTFKCITWNRATSKLSTYSLNYSLTHLSDFVFLHGFPTPVIALIYGDLVGRHVITCRISLDEQEFETGPWSRGHIEWEAHTLIAVPPPLCGVIVVGCSSLLYIRDNSTISTVSPPFLSKSIVNCYDAAPDGLTYILGQLDGTLSLLKLEIETDAEGKVMLSRMRATILGVTSPPDSLSYMHKESLLFVGSRIADSKLLRLNSLAVCDETWTEVESFPNLAPIVDMVLVDMAKQGQGEIIACSGYGKDGSLKVIRSGIGLYELARLDIPFVNRVWALRYITDEPYDNLFIMGVVGNSTMVIKFQENQAEQITVDGLETAEQTFVAANCHVTDGALAIVQVVRSKIQLADASLDGRKLDEWKFPDDGQVSLASCEGTSGRLLVACRHILHYFNVCDGRLKLVTTRTMENEASCVEFGCLSDEGVGVCIVAHWTKICLQLLFLPSLEPAHTVFYVEGSVIRSALMCNFESNLYLFVSLADGNLIFYTVDEESYALVDGKKVSLGTDSISLKMFKTKNTLSILACTEKPTVIYMNNNKLQFSSLDSSAIYYMTPLFTSAYDNGVLFTNGQCLTIGIVDEIKKLHIRSVVLGETPRRIVWQPENRLVGVLTIRITDLPGNSSSESSASNRALHSASAPPLRRTTLTVDPNSAINEGAMNVGAEDTGVDRSVETHSFLLLDQNSFDVLHAYSMSPLEECTSILSCTMGEDQNPFFILSAAVITADDTEPLQGRLLVLRFERDGHGNSSLNLVHEKEVNGCVYAMASFKSKLLVAMNSSVLLFEWSDATGLQLVSSCSLFVTAMHLKVRDDVILVGDIQRSIAVLKYVPSESSFVEEARDYHPNWISAIEVIDNDYFMAAENSLNITISQKDLQQQPVSESQVVKSAGRLHLGEYINVFKHGALSMYTYAGISSLVSNPIMIGTAEGSILIYCQIRDSHFRILNDLQRCFSDIVPDNVGCIAYDSYRRYVVYEKNAPAFGFIDGDLIEQLLEMPRQEAIRLINGWIVAGRISPERCSNITTAQQIIDLIEELSRIH
ncbi:DNA damage-binding protein 1 [Trichinella pseudospiralis]|uniref:DNA damage-binding protein 1 n=1 Tax=Trichinella pseudospiralis TaxID=6337 RepID=A0A0V1HR90_TRIPS|nr:DNA damage-binding protein 1 [Trichinella pseudospiralis]KRZ43605.1 DNA damage-binding protein 1 [Trichinella pseudospiralis]